MVELEQQLRGVQLPVAPSWWPLSWVGWLVSIALVCVIVLLSWHMLVRWRRGYAKRIALQRIQTIKNLSINEPLPITDVVILLRRVALAYFPRKTVAGLIGPAWIEFLNNNFSKEFDHTAANILLTAPYQKQQITGQEQLVALIEQWIKERK